MPIPIPKPRIRRVRAGGGEEGGGVEAGTVGVGEAGRGVRRGVRRGVGVERGPASALKE